MTLQEAESKLSDLNNKIAELLSEREEVIKEWHTAFNSENPENIICIDENEYGFHKLYLANGDFKILVCRFSERDIKGSINDFYRIIDNSIHILNIANEREFDSPEYQKNLIYVKAIEIRDGLMSNQQELLQTLAEAENDIIVGKTAPLQNTFDDIRTCLLKNNHD